MAVSANMSANMSQSLNMGELTHLGLGESTSSMNVSGNTPLEEVRKGINFDGEALDEAEAESIMLKPGTIGAAKPPVAQMAGDENFSPN